MSLWKLARRSFCSAPSNAKILRTPPVAEHAQPIGFYGFTQPDVTQYESYSKSLKQLALTAIIDALWILNYPQSMVHSIQKVSKESQTQNHVGLALTLRFVPFRNDLMAYKPSGYASPEYAAFELVSNANRTSSPYQYSIVMGTVGPHESIGGDIKLSMLRGNANLSCIVCDGGIRDIDTVQTYNIPIYASSVTCKQGPATQIPWSVNEVVCLPGNVCCAPYDFVVADEHNVVIVPQKTVAKVIDIATLREKVEECIKLEIGEQSTNEKSRIPHFYPFPTPIDPQRNDKLVQMLKKHGEWESIKAMQNQIFSS